MGIERKQDSSESVQRFFADSRAGKGLTGKSQAETPPFLGGEV